MNGRFHSVWIAGSLALSCSLGGGGAWAASFPAEPLDESVNWIVEDAAVQDFSEGEAAREIRSPRPAGEEKSIHQLQQEEYDALGLKSEEDADQFLGYSRRTLPKVAAAGGTLQKRVVGWHPYWMGTAYQRYDYSKLSTIAYFSYEVNPTNGSYSSLRSWDTTPILAWAHSNGVKVVLTATLFGSANNARLLTNAASCSNLIDSLVTVVSNRAGDGVNIDFESVGSAQKSQLTTFMSNLAARFHRDLPGSEVSIALPAIDWGGAYDVGAYDGFLDYALIMGYDYHWRSSTTAGPVAPLSASSTWGTTLNVHYSITNYLGKGIRAEKLLLACPYYGYDWPTTHAAVPAATTGSGSAVLYPSAKNNAAAYGRQWNSAGSSPYYVYTNTSSIIHQGWYDDAESLGRKYDLVLSRDIGGIGIWALGYDDTLTELWDLIGEKFLSAETDWQLRESGTATSFYGVGAKGGAYAAVGAGGMIRTSPDGLAWSAATSGVSELLLNVNGAGGNWVAAGDLGRLLTSPDGVTWTARTPPTNAMLRAIAWGNGVHVAGGASGVILRSTNGGTNWTLQTSGTAETIQGLLYGGGQFVAVGTAGLILTSPDGATWTARTSGTTTWLLDAAYGDGLYAAVGLSGIIRTSADGVTWTAQTSGTSEHLYRAAYGDGRFVAVGTLGSIFSSTNGVAWAAEASGTTNMLRGVVFSNNQFVAAGFAGTILTKGVGDSAVAIATLGATVPNETTSQTISGTANSFATGTMRWTNSLGGSGTFAAATNWSFSAALSVGTNLVTVTATNSAGRSASASVPFIRQAAAGGGGALEETTASQPAGGLSDIIVYTSAGHGFTGDTGAWITGRGLTYGMVEDIGNVDQLNYFADYCFKAGATVVPMRPLGQQTNEVVLDNTNAANVTFGGSWSDSSSTIFYGSPGATPYRYAYIHPTGTTAWAVYRPNLPVGGFYPVYAWTRSGSDRVKQLYRVYHSGGVTDVRVNHRRVGLGWVWLGTYYFEAGTHGSVNLSNYAPGGYLSTDVVIADAIRFGNGMGDIDRGYGVSGFERELEAARYWVQRMTGQGMSSTLYDLSGYNDSSDNVGAPVRMAAEMNREADGGFWDRIYLGFHSNADGGAGTARGPMGLWDNRGTTEKMDRQKDFGLLVAKELTNDLGYGQSGVLFLDGYANNSADLYGSAYGELYGTVNAEMNSTIIETAFHNNSSDANLLKDPAARCVMAMASYQAIVKHLATNNPAVVSPVLLPDPPTRVRVANSGAGTITLAWQAPATNRAEGHAATGYAIYRSTNGYGFGNPVAVSGGSATSRTLTHMPLGQMYYFQVCATNAGGESLPSKTVGVRVSPAGEAPHLVVNGFERNERRLSPNRYFANNINGDVARVIQRRINAQDYVVQHGSAIAAAGRYFDSCDNASVSGGDVDLADYFCAYWILGRESVTHETFSAAEQALVTDFLNPGRRLFVSGAELAYDLISLGSASDKAFCTNVLKTGYSGDDAGTSQVTAKTGGLFDGLGAFTFDYAGTGSTYRALYPDKFLAAGVPSSTAALVYAATTNIAGLAYSNLSRLVVLGFPFETIDAASARTGLLARVISFFGDAPSDAPVVDITTADQSVAAGTADIVLAGTNNAAVAGWMAWSNQSTGASGTFDSALSWTTTVSLANGVNTVRVSGVNYLLTQTATDTVRVTVVASSLSSLGVAIEPAGAVSVGALWRVDGGIWRNSGAVAADLVQGLHTASFSSVTGWTSPPPCVVQTTNGFTTAILATYTQMVGSLQVTISPSEAVAAGAQWRVNGGDWRDSGTLAVDLAAGSHPVSFSAVTGWAEPADQAVTVDAGETATSGGLYTRETGFLTVLIDPPSAVDAGAQWNVDDGAWRASGDIVADVATGIHTVRYSTVGGFTAPVEAVVTVSNGLVSPVYGTYVAGTASATVSLVPAGAMVDGAQWRLDGGSWQMSGTTLADLALGSHTLSFHSATGWSTPADQSISLSSDQLFSTSVIYAVWRSCPGADNAQQTGESDWTNRTAMVTGEAFNKAWTLRNTGSNVWTAADGYDLRRVSGESFGISSPIALAATDGIAPGGSKTFSVSGIAPSAIGETRGIWMMHHDGTAFGDPVWIRIETEAPGGGAQ